MAPLQVWPPDRFRWSTSTPLLVRAQGLQLRDPVQGVKFLLSSFLPIKSIRPTEEGLQRREGWLDPADG